LARPVLLLPGLLRPPSDWNEVAAHLADLDVRALDVDGPPWRPDEAEPAIEARLRRDHPDGAHLVGHSRGAALASWIAVRAPELVATLTIVGSPPQPSEVFRAYFRDRIPHAKDAHQREALEAMAAMPDDAFPGLALRRYQKPALVVELADDPLYSPTHTLFWRMFLPYANFERVEDADHVAILRGAHAKWLADRIRAHFLEAERGA
jgi:pimeloyl-ACP methyl ester carboxylesterase